MSDEGYPKDLKRLPLGGWRRVRGARMAPFAGHEVLLRQRAAQGPCKNANFSQIIIFQNADHPMSAPIPTIGAGRPMREVASV